MPGYTIILVNTLTLRNEINLPNINAWLITPPNIYPLSMTIIQDWCWITNNITNWISIKKHTFHLNIGSTPNNFLICGYFSGMRKRSVEMYICAENIISCNIISIERNLLRMSILLLACGSSSFTHSKSVLVTEFPIVMSFGHFSLRY